MNFPARTADAMKRQIDYRDMEIRTRIAFCKI